MTKPVLCILLTVCLASCDFKKNTIESEQNRGVIDSISEKIEQNYKSDGNGDMTSGASSRHGENLILAKIDSISLAQIQYDTKPSQSIFDHYKIETEDKVAIWSEKMFGRCCSEADLEYARLLDFNITTNITNSLYPADNLRDTQYRTAYAFKEDQNIEISLKLNYNNEYHLYHTNLSVDEVLKSNDTLLKPFRLSLVNGCVKSEATFKQNGRVKTMDVFLNSRYTGTIQLIDTPLVQEFEIDVVFFKNDTVKLIPKSYYKGTKFNDICISEIQNNLGDMAHPSINNKYVINELYHGKLSVNRVN